METLQQPTYKDPTRVRMGTVERSEADHDSHLQELYSKKILKGPNDFQYIRYKLSQRRRVEASCFVAEAFNTLPAGWIVELVKQHYTDRIDQLYMDCDYRLDVVRLDGRVYEYYHCDASAFHAKMYGAQQAEKLLATRLVHQIRNAVRSQKRPVQ